VGGPMTLPLYGTASHSAGFSDRARSVIRLRRVDSRDERHPADFALARTPDEVLRAIEADWPSIFVVSDGSIDFPGTFKGRLVAVPLKYNYLADGDVLGFDHSSRKFRTLFRRNSAHNSFLVTERCNNYCLMCSQPPKDVDDRWILSEIRESLPLIDPAIRALTFTGGETLSDWEEFIFILKECRDRLPATSIQVLTNGRAFAESRIVDAWKAIGHPNLMAAIPVYASVDHLHDYVVQAKGAFDETILGILKLKDRGQRIEIRVVLHALTAPIIEDTGRWIARNLPFVDHVALMGLENTGFAIANDAMLWMDPVDYRDGLARAVDHLSSAGVRVRPKTSGWIA
jgi:His-Xaa-Ser system radical SAM maturase HxsC